MRVRGGGRSEVYEFEQPNLIKDQHNHNFVFFSEDNSDFFKFFVLGSVSVEFQSSPRHMSELY